MEDYNFTQFLSQNRLNILNELIKFDSTLRPFYSNSESFYSFFGINFNDKEVTSVKFYYVFFDPLIFKSGFPLIELQENYEKSILHSSKHVGQYLSNGGGTTLTIKFDCLGEASIGYYFRKLGNNCMFISNILDCYPSYKLKREDFESGYGEYLMLRKGKTERSEYIYLKNRVKFSKFHEETGINFKLANCIEISSANIKNTNSHKFIAIGGTELFGDSFKNNIPNEFTQLANKLGAKLICPATYLNQKKYSCYAYKNNSNLVNSFIKEYSTSANSNP